eukprot:CCRYP_012993-RA/>CCRYP_012993-RA protein AED:0.00 eAED:0.00 QI:102/1/1/1/0/0/2/107/58
MVCSYPSDRCLDLPQGCSLVWGSELPCWGVHAVGRWTLLLGSPENALFKFCTQGYKKG